MTTKAILCELYDYIEIACTFKYPVLLVLENGKEVEGVATDTSRNDAKEECLVLIEKHTQEKLEVVLSHLSRMKALIENPHFESVDFKKN